MSVTTVDNPSSISIPISAETVLQHENGEGLPQGPPHSGAELRKECTPSPDADYASPTKKLEREASLYRMDFSRGVKKLEGRYLRDEEGNYHLLLGGKRVPLNYERDNCELNALMLNLCHISIHTQVAKLTISRIIDEARKAADKFKLRQFSAISKDGKRLYVPFKDISQLVLVTAETIELVPNGANEDGLYVEHPNLDPESEALDYSAESCADPMPGLDDFERLIVKTQACRVPEMAWFVAIQEGLLPFVRHLYRARFILLHEGPPGSGKTSGGEFLCILHGLAATGDVTVASLRRLGDCGLLMMDNKEQQDMSHGFNNSLLYLATGTQSLRCEGENEVKKGNIHRPIGALTSIEGAYKEEVRDRTVEITYNAHERDRAGFPYDALCIEITGSRHRMISSLLPALQRFLKINQEGRTAAPVPESLARFGGNFTAVCNLLRAYEEIAGKPARWSESMIEKWRETLRIQSHEADGGELEDIVLRFLRTLEEEPSAFPGTERDPNTYVESSTTAMFGGQKGSLVVTTTDKFMDWSRGQDRYSQAIPKTAAALGRRLRSLRSRTVKVLDEQNAPELPQLKRKTRKRLIGFFEPEDDR